MTLVHQDEDTETRSAMLARIRAWETDDLFPRDEDALLIVRRALGDTWSEPDYLRAVTWLRDGGEAPAAIRAFAATSSALARELEIVSRPANLDDAQDPKTIDVQAASAKPLRSIVDPEQALEAALAARERGEDDLPILRFAVDAIRRARQLGLAGIGGVGVTLTLLAGGRAEAASDLHGRRFLEPSKNISFTSRRRRVRSSRSGRPRTARPAPPRLVVHIGGARILPAAAVV